MAGRPCACGCGRFVWGRRRVHLLCLRETRGSAEKNAARDRRRAVQRADLSAEQIKSIIAAHLQVIKYQRQMRSREDAA